MRFARINQGMKMGNEILKLVKALTSWVVIVLTLQLIQDELRHNEFMDSCKKDMAAYYCYILKNK